MSSRSKSLRQRGIASVEFAIALPVLLLVLFATAEIGRLLSQYDTLTKAVRDGAKYCASHALSGSQGVVDITLCTTAAQPANATQNLVVFGNIGCTTATCGSGSASPVVPPVLPGLAVGDVTVSSPTAGYISVSASYTYQPMLGALQTFGLYGSSISLAIPLNATVVMKAL
jgi:Flp pilus assembly protein TadG